MNGNVCYRCSRGSSNLGSYVSPLGFFHLIKFLSLNVMIRDISYFPPGFFILPPTSRIALMQNEIRETPWTHLATGMAKGML